MNVRRVCLERANRRLRLEFEVRRRGSGVIFEPSRSQLSRWQRVKRWFGA